MFEWPLDKLGIVNRALDRTSNNPVAVADDGSEEWAACSAAYEDHLPYMIEQHPWSWARTMVVLQPAPNAPADDQWDTAFNLPADLVHLIYIRIEDRPAPWLLMMGPPSSGSRMQLCCNAQGGPPAPIPPQVPAVVTAAYVSSTASDPQFATATFVKALTEYVIAGGVYQGLQEDADAAFKMMQMANRTLAEARIRHDQQGPKRALYNSRMQAARRIRRPGLAPPGAGWSGTGVPG
jgi:hypothetical protein